MCQAVLLKSNLPRPLNRSKPRFPFKMQYQRLLTITSRMKKKVNKEVFYLEIWRNH